MRRLGPVRILLTAVLQQQAKRWMNEQWPCYELVTSQLVVTEAGGGDPDAASRRLAMLADIPILEEHPDVDAVADELITQSLIPAASRLDALHVATAALAGVQYLLTQNCRHIANARVLPVFTDCSTRGDFPECWFARPSNSLEVSPMAKNPILNELYDIRARILADHGENLRDCLRSEFERLKTEGHPVAKIKQRTIRRTGAAKPADSPIAGRSSPGDR